MLVGYVRVSTVEQNEERQIIEILDKAGVEKKSDGYINLNGGKEIVTWCYGHIL